jgi:hypothetical protein
MSSVNITDPDVDMESEAPRALSDIMEEEEAHPNPSKDKGKSRRIPTDDDEEDEDIASTGKAHSKPESTSSYLKRPNRSNAPGPRLSKDKGKGKMIPADDKDNVKLGVRTE